MAQASIEASTAQRLGVLWAAKMNAKGGSRVKENIHLETYFHVRSGSETFRERYSKG